MNSGGVGNLLDSFIREVYYTDNCYTECSSDQVLIDKSHVPNKLNIPTQSLPLAVVAFIH